MLFLKSLYAVSISLVSANSSLCNSCGGELFEGVRDIVDKNDTRHRRTLPAVSSGAGLAPADGSSRGCKTVRRSGRRRESSPIDRSSIDTEFCSNVSHRQYTETGAHRGGTGHYRSQF